jgi:hypothetical protein
MIGTGLFLPTQTPALAKTHFKKAKKIKHRKHKANRRKADNFHR